MIAAKFYGVRKARNFTVMGDIFGVQTAKVSLLVLSCNGSDMIFVEYISDVISKKAMDPGYVYWKKKVKQQKVQKCHY